MKIVRHLRSSTLSRNILAVATGTAAGQAVAFAFSPLITRIYGPEIFGIQGVFLALVSILSPVVALRYPLAIIVADNDSDAWHLRRLAMRMGFALSAGLTVLLLLAAEPISVLLGAEALGPLIWFLPLALLCVAAQDVAGYTAARRGQFRLVGVVTVVQAFLANLARVLGGLAAPIAGVLVAVTSVAPAVQAGLLNLRIKGYPESRGALGKEEVFRLLSKHRDFPLFRMPTDVLNSASQSVPVIMLAALYSPTAAGLYALTRSVLNLPANLINAAIGNVLYARFAELSRSGSELWGMLLKSTLYLLSLAPIIIGVSWFSPDIFAFIFGEEWREAGHYAQWMAIWISLMIVNVPTSRIVAVIGRQGLSLLFNVALLGIRVLSVLAAAWTSADARTAVAWFSISSAGMIVLSLAVFSYSTYRFDMNTKASNGY
ncbi:oligosaccharide flippase family protein [Pacificimonas flava]|uniref:oligosaccharide flippase family protein n=1 Tax=Pacificimonas flava TaxID=1234595 RepID=UPI00135F1979|nr:oligosaccharide flippase family protein [Pacificimonas flava]MBB5281781.1 O-antigen/teichoic acid export membrane protein [Pacificimonas flava]